MTVFCSILETKIAGQTDRFRQHSKWMTIYLLGEIQQVIDLFTSPRLEPLINYNT